MSLVRSSFQERLVKWSIDPDHAVVDSRPTAGRTRSLDDTLAAYDIKLLSEEKYDEDVPKHLQEGDAATQVEEEIDAYGEKRNRTKGDVSKVGKLERCSSQVSTKCHLEQQAAANGIRSFQCAYNPNKMKVEIQESSTLPNTLLESGSSFVMTTHRNWLSSSLLYEEDGETVKGGTFRDLLTHFTSKKDMVPIQVNVS